MRRIMALFIVLLTAIIPTKTKVCETELAGDRIERDSPGCLSGIIIEDIIRYQFNDGFSDWSYYYEIKLPENREETISILKSNGWREKPVAKDVEMCVTLKRSNNYEFYERIIELIEQQNDIMWFFSIPTSNPNRRNHEILAIYDPTENCLLYKFSTKSFM